MLFIRKLRYAAAVLAFMLGLLVSANEGDAFSYLKQMEGVDSIAIENLNLHNVLDTLVRKGANAPTPKQLYHLSSRADSKGERDILFVLYAFASALNDQQEQAYKRWMALAPSINMTFMDEQPNAPEQVMQVAYNWLINNTDFVVPASMVRAYPELIHNTPFWFATRDSYFRVNFSEEGQKQVLQSKASLKLNNVLIEAFNPGGCWMGSKVNARYKHEIIQLSLLLEAPDYYIAEVMNSNLDIQTSDLWINYWGVTSPIEKRLVDEINAHKEDLIQTIREFLITQRNIEQKVAILAAQSFTYDQITKLTDAPISYKRKHQKILASIKANDFSIITQLPTGHHQSVVAGLMLSNGSNEMVVTYYLSLLAKQDYPAADELLELTAATDRTELLHKLVRLKAYSHSLTRSYSDNHGFTRFGKTPLMYAVQHDQLANYELLTSQQPETINHFIPSNDGGCGPSITGRTVLSYALEGSSKELINRVINDVKSDLFINNDSAGRNIFAYLSNNQKLTDAEIVEVRGVLFESLERYALLDNFSFYQASFSCREAKNRVELKTCSSERNAQLDQQLSQAYNAAKTGIVDTHALLVNQRNWLKARPECIFEHGFDRCYISRIEYLDALLLQ